MMPVRVTVLLAALAVGQSCDTDALKKQVLSFYPGALSAHAAGQVTLIFSELDRPNLPERAGLIFKNENGTEVMSSACKPGPSPEDLGDVPAVLCPTTPFDVGSYTMSYSGDTSCGAESFKEWSKKVEVIEPAHIHTISPAHGPVKEKTKITISGSNIGGPHVVCEFTFLAGEGAKLGCDMRKSAGPAEQSSPTSAVCTVPAWPGPVQQYDGHGFKPAEGAVCSNSVVVKLTNDAEVFSVEPTVFEYDSADLII